MFDSLDLHHNVRVVSNDIKSRAVSTLPFIIKICNFANYYPFGMQQTATAGSYDLSSDYRYGYNGKEKDEEISRNGNHTTAEFWEYDTRLGRRWNIDPRPNISMSSYATFAGNPIIFSDYLGDTVNVNGDLKIGVHGPLTVFVSNAKSYIEEMKNSDLGSHVINRLEQNRT